VAVKPSRARFADRDEYPPLGVVVTPVPTSGRVMGPTPLVHLGNSSVLASVMPLPRVRAVVPVISPVTPVRVEPVRSETVAESAAVEVIPAPVLTVVDDIPVPVISLASDAPLARTVSLGARVAEPARTGLAEWKAVDPETARDALRVLHEVEIPQGRHRTRRPRPAQMSSGDATERMARLDTINRRRGIFMVAASILVMVGLFGAIWRFANVGYAADQTATSWNQVAVPDSTVTPNPSPAVSASATPSSGPSTTQAPAPTEDATTEAPAQTTKAGQVPAVLRANAIYGSSVTGSCPEQPKPTDADSVRAALTAYVDCMNTIWSPILDAGNFRFRPASVEFFVNTIVNPCATLHTTDAVTAMYCPMDATIYVSPDGVSSAINNRYYGAELVTHEYAHHVQSLSQILAVAGTQSWSKAEYSRRIQLQAHCLSFAVINHVTGFNPDPTTFRLAWQVGPGSDAYGSIASLTAWGEKGLAAKRVGDCDTFSVPASAVA
jgi:hypothetical protein